MVRTNTPPLTLEQVIFTPTESVYSSEANANTGEQNQNIQEILNKFKKPIPSEFIQIEIEEHLSKRSGQERYLSLINGKYKILVIPDSLELNSDQIIDNPVYLPSALLDREEGKDIIIRNGEEIFLDCPLNFNNLEIELKRIFAKLENLKEQSETQQELIANLQNEKERLVSRLNELEESLNQTQSNSQNEITKLKDWVKQVKMNLVPLFWPNAIYTEDTPTAKVLTDEIKALANEKAQISNKLREKEEKIIQLEREINNLIQGPTKEELDEEIKRLNEELNSLNQQKSQIQIDLDSERNKVNGLQKQINQKNNEINNLEDKVRNLERSYSPIRRNLDFFDSDPSCGCYD